MTPAGGGRLSLFLAVLVAAAVVVAVLLGETAFSASQWRAAFIDPRSGPAPASRREPGRRSRERNAAAGSGRFARR